MGVVPINLPTFLSCYAMMYFSCRLPQCHSPSPPIVTSCSAPQQHDPFVVVLFRRSCTSCTAPPGCNDRPLLHIVSVSLASSWSARPRKRFDCHDARLRGGGGRGGITGPTQKSVVFLHRPNMVPRLT